MPDVAFAEIDGMPQCPACGKVPARATVRFGGPIRGQLVLPSASLSCGDLLDADWTAEFYGAIPARYKIGAAS